MTPRLLKNADGVRATTLEVVGSVVGGCDGRAAFDRAPRLPAAGTPLVSAINEVVQAGLDSGAQKNPKFRRD